MTAAQHWRKAEEFARDAGDPIHRADYERLVSLSHLHIEFAKTLDKIARERDGRGYGEPVGEDMAGAPRPGDIWIDGQDAKWLYESGGHLVALGDPEVGALSGTFDEIRELRGPLWLEYRTRLPLDDVFDQDPPF